MGAVKWRSHTLPHPPSSPRRRPRARTSSSFSSASYGEERSAVHGGAALAGFFSLGLEFLIMMQITLTGRLTVLLHHPPHALVVVAALLVFAAIGGWLAGRCDPEEHSTVARLASGSVAARGLSSPPDGRAARRCTEVKLAAALALVAPIATPMRMPIPHALARLQQPDPALVTREWGTSGCASVGGAMFATLLAIDHGQTSVIGRAPTSMLPRRSLSPEGRRIETTGLYPAADDRWLTEARGESGTDRHLPERRKSTIRSIRSHSHMMPVLPRWALGGVARAAARRQRARWLPGHRHAGRGTGPPRPGGRGALIAKCDGNGATGGNPR